MDYEKKYKDTLEKAKEVYNRKDATDGGKLILESMFPELKESEDETSKHWILEYLYDGLRKSDEQFKDQFKAAIAWFEKQVELQYWKPSEEQLEALDYAYNSCPDTERGNYYEGVLRTLIDELYKLQEMQGKKPSDNAQSKFKVGDWCIDNEDNTIFQITKVLYNLYYYRTNEGKEYSCTRDSIERDAHLWTIQDAKDGDVLAVNWLIGDDSWEKIIIFKKYHDKGVKGLLNVPCVEGYGNTFKNGKLAFSEAVPYFSQTWTSYLHPATKEQRDILMKAIADAGYELECEIDRGRPRDDRGESAQYLSDEHLYLSAIAMAEWKEKKIFDY